MGILDNLTGLLIGALAVVGALVAAYFKGRSGGKKEAQADHLKDINNAKDAHIVRINEGQQARNDVRTDLTNNPDKLREDDGFKRD